MSVSYHLREEILAAVRGGASLQDIEREIVDPAALAEDDRAALWLFAWGTAERRGAAPAGLPEIVAGGRAR
jgi:hypothetical protein